MPWINTSFEIHRIQSQEYLVMRQDPLSFLGLFQPFGIPSVHNRIVVLGQTHRHILADNVPNRASLLPHANFKLFCLFLLCFYLRVYLFLGSH